MGADAMLTVSLAGTLFFTEPTHAARPHVILYLLLTMTPFAIVAPVVGPVIDRLRHWKRLVIATTLLGRATLCVLMTHSLTSLALYPEAFGVLLLSKCYLVAKGAVVPAFVADEKSLVSANARLARMSLIAAAVAGGVAAGVYHVSGSAPTLFVSATVYVAGAYLSARLPKRGPGELARTTPTGGQHEEWRPAPGVVVDAREVTRTRRRIAMAASAMGLLRGAVGFLTFLVVFVLKNAHEGLVSYAAVAAASGIGAFIGAMAAPPLRRRISEETLMGFSMVAPAVVALVDLWRFGQSGVAVVAFALGIGASAARVAFDSLVQRSADETVRGRAFARFETRFQITWVLGALLAVVVPLGLSLGLVVLAGALGLGTLSYLTTAKAAAAAAERGLPPPPQRNLFQGLRRLRR